MKINVTQRDISLARKRRKEGGMPSKNCPVALAMKRISHRQWRVPYSNYAQLKLKVVQLPAIATSNIDKWDADKRMYPFTFEI